MSIGSSDNSRGSQNQTFSNANNTFSNNNNQSQFFNNIPIHNSNTSNHISSKSEKVQPIVYNDSSISKVKDESVQNFHSSMSSNPNNNLYSQFRQLIRYEKELVALQYRQECLEGKLASKNIGNEEANKLRNKLQKVSV